MSWDNLPEEIKVGIIREVGKFTQTFFDDFKKRRIPMWVYKSFKSFYTDLERRKND